MIQYTDNLDNIAPGNLQGFFAGWPNPPDPETHLKILSRAYTIVLAVDTGTGNVIGFINAISDGIHAAYIPLLEVLPDYQRQGIATKLMKFMISKLSGLYMIDLVTEEDLVTFYERFGMAKGIAMMFRDMERQGDRVEAR